MTYQESAIEVVKKIIENGFEAYLVGGFVRDHLLHLEENDIDITTSALPKDLKNIFPVIDSGIKFNSVTIVYNDYRFETTTFREDLNYEDNRHPTYRVAKTLKADLKRRDFTINALAMNVKGEVIDCFDGLGDLDKKLVKAIGEPQVRFTEDALRMLRACYFAAKLDFQIEDKTLMGIKKCSHLLQNLSRDRILWELEKIFNTKHQHVGINYLFKSYLILYLNPFKDALALIKDSNETFTFFEFLTLSFYFNHQELSDYTFKKTTKTAILKLLSLFQYKTYDEVIVFDYGQEMVLEANKLRLLVDPKYRNQSEKILKIAKELTINSFSELAFKVQDILDTLALEDKKEVGIILNDLKKQILKKKLVNSKEKIQEYVLKKYK